MFKKENRNTSQRNGLIGRGIAFAIWSFMLLLRLKRSILGIYWMRLTDWIVFEKTIPEPQIDALSTMADNTANWKKQYAVYAYFPSFIYFMSTYIINIVKFNHAKPISRA